MLLVNLGCGRTYHAGWRNYDFVAPDENVTQHDLLTGVPLPDGVADAVYHSHVLEHFTREAGTAFLTECYRALKSGGIIRIAVPDLEGICRAYLASIERVRSGDQQAIHDHQWMLIELMDQLVRTKVGGDMGHYWRQQKIENYDFIHDRLGDEFFRGRSYIEETKKFDEPEDVPEPTWQQKLIAKFTGYSVTDLQYLDYRKQGELHQWMYDAVSLVRLLQSTGFKDAKVRTFNDSDIPDWSLYELEVRNGKVLKPDSLIIEAIKP